jgi:hypothetical protein
MKRFICIFAILSLSACARQIPPEKIAAAKALAEQQVPLTPVLRNDIAIFVKSAIARERYSYGFEAIQQAEISPLEVGPTYNIPRDDKLNSYYCVRVTIATNMMMLYVPAKSYYKVTVLRAGPNQYSLKTYVSSSSSPVECRVEANYQPFLELR